MTAAIAVSSTDAPVVSMRSLSPLENLPVEAIGLISDFFTAEYTFLTFNRVSKSICQGVRRDGLVGEKTKKAWEVVFGAATGLSIPAVALLVESYADIRSFVKFDPLYHFATAQLKQSFTASVLQHALPLTLFDLIDLPMVNPMNRLLRPELFAAFRGTIPSDLSDAAGKAHAIMKTVSRNQAGWSILVSIRIQNSYDETCSCLELYQVGRGCMYDKVTEIRNYAGDAVAGLYPSGNMGTDGVDMMKKMKEFDLDPQKGCLVVPYKAPVPGQLYFPYPRASHK